jgi:hypothetical protein
MIGVLCKYCERDSVQEFFELFKTPWEFFDSRRKYDVVISTSEENFLTNAPLIILYSSKSIQYDDLNSVNIELISSIHSILVGDSILPIYGQLSNIVGQGIPIIFDYSKTKTVAVEFPKPCVRIFRVGFDLFQEIAFLLTDGQPVENALIPTLDLHISLLRSWINESGVPWVEIPPVPFGYGFFVCLTHDVDFAGIRRHKLDHTMWGFVYRSLLGSLVYLLKGRISLSKLRMNWLAVVKLPLIYMGIIDDFMDHFDRYAEIDNGFGSTFFIIPFKNRAGDNLEVNHRTRRATRYDINDVKNQVKLLTTLGNEIGLHGIDAWHSSEKGSQEQERIVVITGQKTIGVRMHWLCYKRNSPVILDQAGFDYDATLGYNETVGFRCGTCQIFKPLGAIQLLELPLVIQDTALFSPHRLDLSDSEANKLVNILLEACFRNGGALTVSWHERSLVPERQWGDFYLNLIQGLRQKGAWIGTAQKVVDWFRYRRSIRFGEPSVGNNIFKIQLDCNNFVPCVPILIRLHVPYPTPKSFGSQLKDHRIDLPWNGEMSVEIPLYFNEEIG